jgi:nucleoside-diphosphate-sugar epimerase
MINKLNSVEEIYQTTFFKDKSVLITGASGLVGSNLLRYFDNLNRTSLGPERVFALSKSGSYNPFAISNDLVKYVNGNLLDPNFIEQLPESDIIIHCAGYAQPSLFLANPLESISLNTSVLIQLFSKLKKNGVMANLSSSEVYNGNQNFPQDEHQIGTTTPDHPRAAYIESKRCGEAIINAFRHMNQEKSVSLRLSLAYGPGTKRGDKRVLSQFIEKALSEKKIVLRDQGSAIRTYLYIDDAIEQIIGAILWGDESVYNIAGTQQVSILGLAQAIADLTDSTIILPEEMESNSLAAPDTVWCDSQKINRLIGKSEFIPIVDGLKNTITWTVKSLL